MKIVPSFHTGMLCLAVVANPLKASSGLVSPDGKLVAYTVPGFDQDANLYNEIFVRATDEGPPKSLGKAAGQRDQANWIGQDRIAIGEFASLGSLQVFDIAGRQVAEIALPPESDPLYLAVSPDGQQVTFTGSRKAGDKTQYGLFVFDVKTRAVRLLIAKPLKTLAAWSPDSRKLALGVGAGYTGNRPLQIVEVKSGKVDETGVLGVGASWSPDGKLIACTTEAGRGGSWFAGIPMDGKLGIYDVEQRTMQVIEGTAGALLPVWSRSGQWVAYVVHGQIGIVRPDGNSRPMLQQIGPGEIKLPAQMGWAGDRSLFIRTENNLIRFDVADAKLTTIAQWETPVVPELTQADFKVIELPRVTVKYARFDEKYARTLGRILAEALAVYEGHGFKMPQNVTLEAQIDPASTALWTDGESHMFLHLKTKELLAPATKTGVFNLYGMCHELGHIAMYRSMENLVGLPQGVGEGWAHYAGSVVITEVADRLGPSIWPESYDVSETEGIGRLKRQAAEDEMWDKMDATSRAALVLFRIETDYGRNRLATAMTQALAQRPTGKDLMPLMVAKLREITSNPEAVNWIPKSVLVPSVEWQTKERVPGDDFFADQKLERDGTGMWLSYDNGVMGDKLSMSGAAQTVLFRFPAGSWQLDGLKLFGARYGEEEPPKDSISIYICDQDFNLLHEIKVPYSSFQKGEETWRSVSFVPLEVPKSFYLGIDFHATAEKGVYVGMDTSVKRSHSRIGMPYAQVNDLNKTADWMIRAHLRPKE